MRKISLLTLIFSLFLPTQALSETWEYKVEEVDLVTKVRVFANDVLLSEDDLEDVLTPLGEDGWELTLMIPRGGTSLLLVFKRPGIAAPPAVPVPAPLPAPPPAVEPPAEPPAEPAPEAVPEPAGPSDDEAPSDAPPAAAEGDEGNPG